MARNPHQMTNQAQRALRKAKAFELATDGMSQRAIGKELGCSHTEVGRLLNEGAEDLVAPNRDAYRAMQMEQYSELIMRYKVAANAEHWVHSHGKLVLGPDGLPMRDWEAELRAQDRYMKALSAQAKLLGINMPTETIQTTRTESPDAGLLEQIEWFNAQAEANRDARGSQV